jgi:hypothetical protein
MYYTEPFAPEETVDTEKLRLAKKPCSVPRLPRIQSQAVNDHKRFLVLIRRNLEMGVHIGLNWKI